MESHAGHVSSCSCCRDINLIRSYSNIWKDNVVLLPYANDLGVGLSYHVCSVVVSELEKMAEAGSCPSHDALRALLDPYVAGLCASPNKILVKKIYSDVFAEIAQRVESRVEPFGSSCDVQSLAEELFSLGTCVQGIVLFCVQCVLMEKTI